MDILLLDPFHTGSHAHWSSELTTGLNQRGQLHIELRTMKGKHWKWRMLGSASAFASTIRKSDPLPDAILTTDMMDVSALRGQLPSQWRTIKIIQYFHENQLTYPWSPTDPDARDGANRIYGFLNIQSALAADAIWFNSRHHKEQFLLAVRLFLAAMPDFKLPHAIETIENKSTVIPIGIHDMPHPDLQRLMTRPVSEPPVLLWNHRWEYDKGPDRFHDTLKALQRDNFHFQLVLLGQMFERMPPAYKAIQESFNHVILHSGWVEDPSEYQTWLSKCDFLIHEPRQEYFGISVLEAMQSGVAPIVSKGHAYDNWMPDPFLRQPSVSLIQQMRSIASKMTENRDNAMKCAQTFQWKTILDCYEDEFVAVMTSK